MDAEDMYASPGGYTYTGGGAIPGTPRRRVSCERGALLDEGMGATVPCGFYKGVGSKTGLATSHTPPPCSTQVYPVYISTTIWHM